MFPNPSSFFVSGDRNQVLAALVSDMRDALGARPIRRRVSPAVEVKHTDNAVEIRAEVPGVKRDAITVRQQGNLLTLEIDRRGEPESNRFDLAANQFDTAAIAAVLEDGILTVTVPRLIPETRVVPVTYGSDRDPEAAAA